MSQAPLGPWRPQGPFVVEAETTFPNYLRHENNVDYLKRHFSHLDPAIIDTPLSVNVRPSRNDESRFATEVILIESGKLGQILFNSPSWEEFRRRFPGSRIAITLSNVAFNDERTTAMIYWDYICGGLCGEGLLTQLDLVDGRWMIQKTLLLWIS